MLDGNVPLPPRERSRWALALVLLLIGAGALAAVLSGALAGGVSQPALPAAAATPKPAAVELDPATGKRVYVSDDQPAQRQAVVAKPPATKRAHASSTQSFSLDALQVPVTQRWLEGFYPIYEVAEHTFHVNWLLIASIHRQETAFSTAPSTYHGLNYAHCCGGPMQFNVTNGGARTLSTWDTVEDSYRDGPRPAYYNHRTAQHPSIYDDFDSIMAATHLLALNGAGEALDASAWWAAYDYYGHDSFGVRYADEVLARAVGWSQHGFCADCGLDSSLVEAVQAAYGVPVLAELEATEAKQQQAEAKALAARRRKARQPSSG
ncbi:MAG TPA: hypothetical protein VGF95_00940 [Solirubrobacteraceae bacterium]|jgi:hypothetical protein